MIDTARTLRLCSLFSPEAWQKLNQILEDYKKEGKSVYTPTFIEDCEDKVKALQAEYGFTYTVELVK